MRLPLPLLVVACTLAACGPPPAGTPVAIDRACDQPDDSRVRLDGYLRYRRGLLSFCETVNGKTTTCDMALYAEATKPADFNVMAPPTPGPEPLNARLTVRIGSGPGQMDDIPDRFTGRDIRLHLEGGTTATDGDRVQIDGKLNVIPASPDGKSPKSCYITVDWAKPAA